MGKRVRALTLVCNHVALYSHNTCFVTSSHRVPEEVWVQQLLERISDD